MKWIKWICVLIFVVIIIVCTYSTYILGILMKHGIALLSFLGISLIIYFFFSDAIFQKCKTCKKLKCIACSIIVAALCVFIYQKIHEPPKVIQMKEDVIYVHPKSPIDTNVYPKNKETVRMQEDVLYKLPKADTTKRKK
jgi:hypothetical protein